jgi:hypothetical protein
VVLLSRHRPIPASCCWKVYTLSGISACTSWSFVGNQPRRRPLIITLGSSFSADGVCIHELQTVSVGGSTRSAAIAGSCKSQGWKGRGLCRTGEHGSTCRWQQQPNGSILAIISSLSVHIASRQTTRRIQLDVTNFHITCNMDATIYGKSAIWTCFRQLHTTRSTQLQSLKASTAQNTIGSIPVDCRCVFPPNYFQGVVSLAKHDGSGHVVC